MKAKACFLYQIFDLRWAVLIYYFSIFCLTLLANYSVITLMASTSTGATTEEHNVIMSGITSSSAIFICIVGLNSFTENFRFSLQNGVSRKTVLRAFTVALLSCALLMGVFDALVAPALQRLFHYDPLMQLIYARWSIAASMLWNVLLYCTGAMFGLFLGSLYYRMSKVQKIVVSIGVPALLCVVFPLVDTLLLHGQLTDAIGTLLQALFGTYTASLLSLLALSLLFCALGHLCARRVPVHE